MGDRPKDGRKYSNPAAAKVFGVSVATIKVWRTKGWLVTTADGALDRLATIARVSAARDPTLGGKPDRLVGGATPISTQATADRAADSAKLLRARTLRETLGAKALRIAIEKEEGTLIVRAEAERIYVEAITDIKNRIEALPIRVAAALVGLDARAIQNALREEVELALRNVSEVPYVGPRNDGGAE
jgi:hypothetical protein